MKAFKLTLASVLCMALFANSKRPLTTATYYYISGSDYQRMQYNHCTDPDPKERGLGCVGGGDFLNTSNWTTTPQSYTVTSDMSKYIGCINFDEESTTDGGADGQLTLSEALTALYNEYVSSGIGMPSSYLVDGNAGITVQAATAVH